MLNRVKYIRFVSDVLEDEYSEIKFIKNECKGNEEVYKLRMNEFLRNSPFNSVVSPEEKTDMTVCAKTMKKFLKSQLKEVSELYDEKDNDVFVTKMLEYFDKSPLKEKFNSRDEFSFYVEELLDEKYSFVKKYVYGQKAEKDNDVRRLMEKILSNPSEIEFIEKSALEASSNLKTFACYILEKEKEQATICNNIRKLKAVNEAEKELLESDSELKEDFKGDDTYLRNRVYSAIADDMINYEEEHR